MGDNTLDNFPLTERGCDPTTLEDLIEATKGIPVSAMTAGGPACPTMRQKQRQAANIAQTRRETKAAEAERWKSKFQHAFCARGNLTVPAATLAKEPSPRAARRANERWAAKPRKPNPF